jgi:hydrogenase maturation protease
VVPSLEAGGRLYQAWQEAVERAVALPAVALADLLTAPRQVPFSFDAARTTESIEDDGREVGVLIRQRQALAGRIDLAAEALDDTAYRVTVRVLNRTPVPAAVLGDQEAVLMRTFASTHTILGVQGGAFLSLMDPPAAYAGAASACENVGTWPVLVGGPMPGDPMPEDPMPGDPARRERDTLLASPIILYDYPEIAAESPGELFDGTEIDEILTLRIMTMTDREKWEMRHVDERARRILQRTESLGAEDLFGLHGTFRTTRPAGAEAEPEGDGHEAFDAWVFPGNNTPLGSVKVGERRLHSGDRVRIRPKKGGDVMDLALDGRAAVIEAIEQDFENRIYLALVLDDDPGRDLGMMRQPGHRFFFGPDEVEPLEDAP